MVKCALLQDGGALIRQRKCIFYVCCGNSASCHLDLKLLGTTKSKGVYYEWVNE